MTYTRTIPDLTLADVMTQLDQPAKTLTCGTHEIIFHIEDEIEPFVQFGADKPVRVPITRDTLEPFCTLLDIPIAYLIRCDNALREANLMAMLLRKPGVVTITYDEYGVSNVMEASVRLIEPRSIVEVAQRIIDEHARVIEFHDTSKGLWLDTVAPSEKFKVGVGGDPKVKIPGVRKVGDFTLGGLRFGQVRDKRNLSPTVEEYFFRLVCTNGAEVCVPGSKVEGRGESPEQKIAELENIAYQKFHHVGATIAAYYDMRNRKAAHPDRMVNRVAKESKLADRTRMALLDALPAEISTSDATEFDVVNLFTNMANEPTIFNKAKVRRQLEVIGGTMVDDHAARCGHCQSILLV